MSEWHLQVEAIPDWPDEDTERRRPSPFRAGYSNTERMLTRELGLIKAKGAVAIQVVTRRGQADVKVRGGLKADARIEHPGVRLSFTGMYGPLTYATDVFTGWPASTAWQQNLRAIVLGLEALRRVDTYGITKSGEQYKGWLQIEGAGPDYGAARNVLLQYAQGRRMPNPPADYDYTELYRLARRATHPDANEGDRTGWDAVEAAAKLLGLV